MRHFTRIHLSEARQELYDKLVDWPYRKDDPMSRLPKKSGYHSHETISCEPVEWVTEYAGPMSTRVSVTYKTGADELVTMYENAPPWEASDLLVENMLAIRGITYPE